MPYMWQPPSHHYEKMSDNTYQWTGLSRQAWTPGSSLCTESTCEKELRCKTETHGGTIFSTSSRFSRATRISLIGSMLNAEFSIELSVLQTFQELQILLLIHYLQPLPSGKNNKQFPCVEYQACASQQFSDLELVLALVTG